MEIINYANGSNMTLPADAQIVQGVSGNAVYLPAGAGTMPIAGSRNELTISLWRQWDGVVEADHYRGVFSTANIKAYFDQATDFLTIELAGTKTVTDIKDDQEQTHWCFLFSKNSFFKIYKNAELKAELTTGNYPVDFSEGFTLGGGRTHATFDEVRMYKTVVTEPEIRGLYRLVTKGTQVQQLENIVASVTPKYLGMVETVPDTRTAIITKGERLGAVDANPGDWVLSGKTIGGWKVGVCYKWSGLAWKPLEPAINYAKEYHACLVHLFEIEELKQQTGHFGALFAKVLVAQKAMIDELLVNQAFIKNLVVRKLKIDTDDKTHQDFEVDINDEVGISVRNKGVELFKVSPNTGAYFSGSIKAGPLELDNTPEKIPDYKASSVSTLFLVDYLHNKQHIPMDIYISNTKYNLKKIIKERKPSPPPDISTDDTEVIANLIKDNSYYFHKIKENAYRSWTIFDIYRKIEYDVTNCIELMTGAEVKKYTAKETADYWEKIQNEFYCRGTYGDAHNTAPSNIKNNTTIVNPIINNIHIIFSPDHKLLKLTGLPTSPEGLTKNTVYKSGGVLCIV